MKNIRWVTALTGLGLVIAAIFSFLSSVISFSLSGIILCIYLCPIGIIISITETQKFFYERVVGMFPILRTHTGRGFSYIFVAGLTISVNTIACWIVGFVLLLEGVISLWYHFVKDKDAAPNDTQMESIESGTASTAYNPTSSYNPANDSYGGQKRQALPAAEPGSRSLAEVDSGADFGAREAQTGLAASLGSTAAAAAFDYAANNPEQAAKLASATYEYSKNDTSKDSHHHAML